MSKNGTMTYDELGAERRILEAKFAAACMEAARQSDTERLNYLRGLDLGKLISNPELRKVLKELAKTGNTERAKLASKPGFEALDKWSNDASFIDVVPHGDLLQEYALRQEAHRAGKAMAVESLRTANMADLKMRLDDLKRLSVPKATPTEIKVMSAKEIYETDWPEPNWAVNEIEPCGLTITAGKPKIGKSWLALQESYSIGTGENFLGYEVEQGRVLYIALEDHPRNIRGRQARQLWDPALNWNVDFIFKEQFWNEIGDIRNGGNERIAWLIEKNNYRLVIVDTFSKAIRGKQRSVEEMTEWLSPIQGTALEKNAVVKFIDHHNKMANLASMDVIDDIMESIGKGAVADTIWGLYRERGSQTARLGMTGRDIPDKSIDLSFDPETCLWRFEGGADRPALTILEKEVLQAFIECGELSNKGAADYLGLSPSNTHGAIQDIVFKGYLIKAGKGKGRAILYKPAPLTQKREIHL